VKKLAFFTLLFSGFVGCLRYTAPQATPSKSASTKTFPPASAQTFRAHEEQQERALKALVVSRLAASKDADESYQIGPGDTVRVSVFDVPELNLSARVKQSGELTLPLVGELIVAGLTESEVQEQVTSKLAHYVRNPQVNIAVADYRAFKVSVLGEVSRPGTYSLKRGDFTLVDVLSEAGGKTEKAGAYIVLIPATAEKVASLTGTRSPQDARASLKRSTSNSSRGIEVPYEALIGNADVEPISIPILAGDTIIVPEAGSVQIDGEVTRPGSFPLNSRMTVLGAIAAAGGLTYSADIKGVEVLREIEPRKKSMLQLDLEKLVSGTETDLYLRNGDVIRVPSHSGRFVTRQVVEGINSLVNFGVGGSVNIAK
jgi:polysaccharide biosynthesis/export protein